MTAGGRHFACFGTAAHAAVLATALSLAAPAAYGQSSSPSELFHRLDRLETELAALQKQVIRSASSSAASAAPTRVAVTAEGNAGRESLADIVVRLTELEGQIQDLTGRVEEVAHGLTQMMERMDRLSTDVDMRLSQVEKAQRAAEATPEPGGAKGLTPSVAAIPGTESGVPLPLGTTPYPSVPEPTTREGVTPQEQYNQAFSLVIQADYPAAERELAAFLEAHPNDPLASNAAYWLAETHYVQKDYAQAAVAFADAYQKYPDGAKAPDSLLKLGMSLANLGQKKEACESFAELERRYPDAPSRVKQYASREKKRLACK
jgi:tol-pal system protein YbgF